MTGGPDDRADRRRRTRRSAPYGGGWLCGDPSDYDREYCVDLVQLARLPASDAARRRRGLGSRRRQPDAAQVPGPPPGRDHQARHHRRAAPRRQARAAPARPLLRHALAGQRQGGRSATRQNRFSVTRQLRYSRDETQLRARPRPVHQRPAGRDLRAEEQPDQADGRGRRRAVPSATATRARSCSSSAAAWPTSPSTTHEVRFCTAPQGQGSWFLPFNQGWNDGAGNPPNPERAQDRLPLEADPHAATA